MICKKILAPLFLVSVFFLFNSCFNEEELAFIVDFNYSVAEGNYTVPVQIVLQNKTAGAIFYQWTFEGAEPSSSAEKYPGTITYQQAGTYTIRLEAWNDFDKGVKELTVQLDSAVSIDFDFEVLMNDFVPATVQITNQTKGASTFNWTFEGGTPSSSTEANPSPVQFDTPGDHTITLEVTNGREHFIKSKTITLLPGLVPDFSIVPAFEDEDYEAPLTASLVNQTISGLTYTWSSTGGNISNSTTENTEIYFSTPGDYTVTLEANNGKETKTIDRSIQVKPNSNLYRINDVQLGISSAHTTIGCFYSTALRKTFTKDEVTNENGSLIDLVFFGINSSFSYCRFISPDSASKFTFPAIPQATHTAFINTVNDSQLSFTVSDFDAMENDSPLQGLAIEANDSGTAYFDSSVVPRVVLFETEDGRKGAIKIKSFVANGSQSYVVMDIKVQKE
jgi:hypothetical protein